MESGFFNSYRNLNRTDVDRNILFKKISKTSGPEAQWDTFHRQSGNWRYSLCESCNNNTGGRYGNAYVDFVKQLSFYADNAPNFAKVGVNFSDIFPLKVFKQILVILCSSSGPSLIRGFPPLKTFLLNREKPHCFDKTRRLMIYLSREKGIGRQTGVAGIPLLEAFHECEY